MPYEIPTDDTYYLNSTYKIIAIGWNSNGEPWPFLTTSARAGSLAFSGTVVRETEIPDYKISTTDINLAIKVLMSGDSTVVEGQSASYTISLVYEDDTPFIAPNDIAVYLGYFVDHNAEMSDINPIDQILIGAGSSSGVLTLTTNDSDQQLDLYRTITVSVLDIDRTGLDLVYIENTQVTSVLLDSEVKPVVSFLIDSQSTIEQSTILNITIVADISPTDYDVYIPLIISGTAAKGGDYTLSNDEAIVLPIGSNSITITATIIADSYIEPDETIIVTMDTPNYATLGNIVEHTITILGEPSVSLEEAVGPTDLVVFSEGLYKWWGEPGVGNNSPSAARAASLPRYQYSMLTTVTTGFGTLSWDWKTAESRSLTFRSTPVSGSSMATTKGAQSDWSSYSEAIFNSGLVVNTWEYASSSTYNIMGNAWVDNIVWTPGQEISIGEAVDNLGITFSTSGHEGGFIGQDVVGSGYNQSSSSASAFGLSNGKMATIIAIVDGPEQELEFRWGFRDNRYENAFDFLVDGIVVATIKDNQMSQNEWVSFSHLLLTGTHQLEWRYTSSNDSITIPMLDNIIYTPS